MKFRLLVKSNYLTEGTDYRDKAIQELVNSGLFNEDAATTFVDKEMRNGIGSGIIHHNNWMSKVPLMLIRKMFKYIEDKSDKKRAISDFKTKYFKCIANLLIAKNGERSKLPTKEQENFSAKFNKEFDAMSIDDIVKLADEIDRKNDEESKAELANMKFDVKSDYDLIPIESYEQMNDMFGGTATGDGGGKSEWCHTNEMSTYDSWVKCGKYKFFVLAKKNWKNIKFDPESNAQNPKDEYGNSLIAILVKCGNNKLEKATLRCNHIGVPANADNQYSKYSELSEIAGFNVEDKINHIIPKKEAVDIKPLYKFFDGTRESLERILQNADICVDQFTKFIIPNSVTTIGDWAFNDCNNLENITIPNSVTAIEQGAFAYCSNLENITIPNSVTSIGNYAFFNCSSLSNITIPDSVTSIGDRAFSGCSSLSSITISNSVKSIRERAFLGCDNLIVHTKNSYVIEYCKKNDIKYVED